MRYYLRGPLTIAGAIVAGGGVLLLLLVSIALILEGRPPWAWLLLFAVLSPMIFGGLLLLRSGLKELTADERGFTMRMPWSRPVRIDFAHMRVLVPDDTWFARVNLILADRRPGVRARMAVPRNLSVYPQILEELRRRAPEVRAAAVPGLPVRADRRFEYIALMALGNLTMLPMLVVLWWNTDLATETTRNLSVGVVVTLLIGGGLAGATFYMLRTLSFARFRRDGVRAGSILGARLELTPDRISRIEVRREERSVKGMRFFEDDLYLTDGEGREIIFPLRLVQSGCVSPRELAERLGAAWDIPVHETERRLYQSEQAPPEV